MQRRNSNIICFFANLLQFYKFSNPIKQHWKQCHKQNLPVFLTLYMLTWRMWWAPNNASKGQMRFNSAFKGLMYRRIRFNIYSLNSMSWGSSVTIVTTLDNRKFCRWSFSDLIRGPLTPLHSPTLQWLLETSLLSEISSSMWLITHHPVPTLRTRGCTCSFPICLYGIVVT